MRGVKEPEKRLKKAEAQAAAMDELFAWTEYGRKIRAAKAAGRSRATVNRWFKKDAAFGEEWAAACRGSGVFGRPAL